MHNVVIYTMCCSEFSTDMHVCIITVIENGLQLPTFVS